MRVSPAVVALIFGAFATPGYPRNIEDTRLDRNCESTLMLSEVLERTHTVETHGVDFHVYPETVPDQFTGCQVVWLGNGYKLATTHYESGRISWVRGQEPKDVRPFFCVYEKGILDKGASFNTTHCPQLEKDLQ